MSFSELIRLIDESIEKLKTATGDDPFLSEKDWRVFLAELNPADQMFFNRLIDLAFRRERIKNPRARVTVSNLEQLKGYIKENIIPHFWVRSGPLFESETGKIESENSDFELRFAQELKIFFEVKRALDEEALYNEVVRLLPLVTLGSSGKNKGRSLKPFVSSKEAEFVNEEHLLEALRDRGDNELMKIATDFTLKNKEDGPFFLQRLPRIQKTDEEKFNANVLRQLLLLHLKYITLFSFISEEQEKEVQFLVGLTNADKLMGFYA